MANDSDKAREMKDTPVRPAQRVKAEKVDLNNLTPKQRIMVSLSERIKKGQTEAGKGGLEDEAFIDLLTRDPRKARLVLDASKLLQRQLDKDPMAGAQNDIVKAAVDDFIARAMDSEGEKDRLSQLIEIAPAIAAELNLGELAKGLGAYLKARADMLVGAGNATLGGTTAGGLTVLAGDETSQKLLRENEELKSKMGILLANLEKATDMLEARESGATRQATAPQARPKKDIYSNVVGADDEETQDERPPAKAPIHHATEVRGKTGGGGRSGRGLYGVDRAGC